LYISNEKEKVMKKLNQTTLKTIRNADDETLNAIIAEIKNRQRQMQQDIGSSFNVGDKVWFDANRRGRIEGMISKINQKTIVVKTPTVTWKVTPSLLKKVA
jgi:predicted DNA-binding ribbon-helix-helix protein